MIQKCTKPRNRLAMIRSSVENDLTASKTFCV